MSGDAGPRAVAFSVDLEPNMDGTLDGVRDAMTWFERTAPRGTVFTTYRIATEMTDLVAELSESFEIAVHVHPREFGHDYDQLAELPADRQRELIVETREAVADAVKCSPRDVTSFRAGRHSASEETLDVLRNLQFDVDASVNVQYDDYIPRSIRRQPDPFEWDNIVEVPTSYTKPSIVSRCVLRRFAVGPLTANGSTLRTDKWGCSGLRTALNVLRAADVGSFYFHPYDAIEHHELENSGTEFRERFERLVAEFHNEAATVGETARFTDYRW